MSSLATAKGELIAVYGSLRRGGNANALLKGCTHLGLDGIAGKLYDLGDIPAASINCYNALVPIVVDVYELPTNLEEKDNILSKIDKYEGYNPLDSSQSLFIRRRTLTTGRYGKWVYAYDYLHPLRHAKQVDSGDWFDRPIENKLEVKI